MLICKDQTVWSKFNMWFKSYEHLTTTCQIYPRQSYVTVLHTSFSTILKCISMYNLIKIYDAAEELWAFSLKYLDWPKRCSAKPRHRFAYQRLDNVKIDIYAKFDSIIPCGSRVMSIFTNCQQRAEMMLSKPSSLKMKFSMPVFRKCRHAYVCKMWSKSTMWFKSYEHFH